ncbi:hypothetical protein F0L74_05185 [Chitinophaga agrisoli]|uniref:O-antigen ligase-related domain-containing protein n=1 Tax=Chitinophaga agrisoli TaxID=2607653 RepID=A0A5B2W397_9BACT|nr:O-antigen ligase family protein [Chitinophaga agrisoli]KAA2245358.1 hypothetical protein F0L74_05185 [Chitinophaga agrisoli]
MEKSLLYIALFLLIMSSGGVLPIMLGGVVFFLLIMVLLGLTLVLRSGYNQTALVRCGSFFFMAIIILITFQLKNTHQLIDEEFPNFLFRFFIAWLAVLCFRLSGRNMEDMIYKLLQVIAWHALLNFFIQFAVGPFLMDIDLEILKVKTFSFIFFYESLFDFAGGSIFRNQGLFWEPGVLAIYLNLLFYISILRKKNVFVGVLSAFLIFTTFSTTGLMLLVVQSLVIFKGVIRKNIAYIVPLLLLCIPILPFILDNFQSKLQDDNGSFLVRAYDYMVSLNMIKDNWLTGVGFGNDVYLKAQESSSFFQSAELLEVRRNSNSIMLLFVSFGIPVGIIVMRYLFLQRAIMGNRWLLLFMVVVGLSSEPLIFTGFFMMMIISGAVRPGLSTSAASPPALPA